MSNNPALQSPCCLYCGVCGIYQATQSNDQKLLKILLKAYCKFFPEFKQLKISDLLCDGCRSDRVSVLCRACSIKGCAGAKKIAGCHECDSFPCQLIDTFPVSNGKRLIYENVLYRQKNGTEMWLKNEESRHFCPDCSNRLYRGCTRCRTCRKPVTID